MNAPACSHPPAGRCYLCSDALPCYREVRMAQGYGEEPPNQPPAHPLVFEWKAKPFFLVADCRPYRDDLAGANPLRETWRRRSVAERAWAPEKGGWDVAGLSSVQHPGSVR